MARERLKKEELDRLLGELFGERRLLMYKLTRVRDAIAELKKLRTTKEASDDAATSIGPKRGLGRPPGSGAKRAYRRLVLVRPIDAGNVCHKWINAWLFHYLRCTSTSTNF